MQLHLAQQLALAEVRTEVSADDLNTALAAFFRYLRSCSVCDNRGEIDIGRGVQLHVLNSEHDRGDGEAKFVRKGTITCPRCGLDPDEKALGDPEFVRWVCVSDDSYQPCTESGRKPKGHDVCGRRIVLPLDVMNNAQT